MEMGNILLRQHIARDVRTPNEQTFKNEDVVYRLLEDENSAALNAGTLSECKPSPAAMVGEEVRRLILKAFADGVSADGRVSWVDKDLRLTLWAQFWPFVKLSSFRSICNFLASQEEEKDCVVKASLQKQTNK